MKQANKVAGYLKLMHLHYDEAIDALNKKHGQVTDDYFTEDSYNKFINGEITPTADGHFPSPIRGRYSRTRDGLYCHHVEEDKYLNLTTQSYCLAQHVPFEAHKKQNLVYADLIEHLILHVLIANETNNHYGAPGAVTYLAPQLIEWYKYSDVPTVPWQRHCYDRAFVDQDDLQVIWDELLKVANPELRKAME